jgi:hypothetical protein
MNKNKPPAEVSAYFRKIAKDGDYPSQGGHARAAKLSAKRRREIAKKAAEASAAARSKKARDTKSGRK